jgi:hypothetical protein
VTPHQEHLAIAGFAMAWGILGRLHSKGIITTEETIDLMDGALLWLEETRGQDDDVKGTRAVLGELIEHIRTMRPDPGPPRSPNIPAGATSNAGRTG